MIVVPAEILERALSQIETQRSAFESLPHDLLLQISQYTDLFTIANIARCSIRLARLVYVGHLLDFDPDHLSTKERTFLLGSIPVHMSPPELRKYYWDSEESDSSGHWREVRPAGICCKFCDYNKIKNRSSKRSYEKAWFRHLRSEVEHNAGRVPRRMVPLLYRALRLLQEEHERKLKRAAFLTLKVPRR